MYVPDGDTLVFGQMGNWVPWTRGKLIIAVGWLSQDHSYSVGDTSAAFQDRLLETCKFSKYRLQSGGFHACEFCGRWLGSDEILVAAQDKVFRAPILVHHYVTAHGYCPPPDFVDAVMAGPRLSTHQYKPRSGKASYGVRETDVDERSRWNWDELNPPPEEPEDDIPEWRKELRKRLGWH